MKNYKKIKWLALAAGVGAIGIGVSCKTISDGNIVKKSTTNSFEDPNPIKTGMTWDRIDQYRKDVLDKIAASLWNIEISKGTSDSTAREIVQKQCGVFVNNLLPFMDHSKTDSDYLNKAYNQIRVEASKIGSDVIDWNDFDKTEKNTIVKSYFSELVKNGVSNQDARQTSDNYLDCINNIENSGKEFMWDNVQLNLQLLQTMDGQNDSRFFIQNIFHKNSLTIHQEKDRMTTARLNVALSYLESNLNTRLTITSDTKNAINLMKEYSANGKYSIGSEIDKNDLQYFFNYQYDPSYGALLNTPKFDYSTPISGDYDTDHLIFQNQQLTSYNINNGPSYETSEILPGYTLHAKIIKEDVDSQANFCNLTFQFGISETNTDPYNRNVVWSDLHDESDKEKNDKVMSVKLPIHNLDNKKYIANNRYYKDQSGVAINTSQYNSNYDAYFVDTANQRKFLDSLLNHYAPDQDHYDFKNNPIYIPIGDYTKGITAPVNETTNLHETEQYVLKISDIDTNVTPDTRHAKCIQANWCVINNGLTNENTQSTSNTEDVKDIPWIINGVSVSTCWIYYDIDPTVQTNILYGTEISLAMKIYEDMSDIQKQTDADKTAKVFNTRVALETLNAGFLAALNILIVANTAWSAITWGSRVAVVAMLLAADGTTIWYMVVSGQISNQYKHIKKFWEWYKTETDSLFSSKVVIQDIHSIAQQYDQLNDPTLSFNSKNNISIEIMNKISSSGMQDKWLQFIRDAVKFENDKAKMDDINKMLKDIKDAWDNKYVKGAFGWILPTTNGLSEILLMIRTFGKIPQCMSNKCSFFSSIFFNTKKEASNIGRWLVGDKDMEQPLIASADDGLDNGYTGWMTPRPTKLGDGPVVDDTNAQTAVRTADEACSSSSCGTCLVPFITGAVALFQSIVQILSTVYDDQQHS